MVVSSGDLHARLRQWGGNTSRPPPPRTASALHERPTLRSTYEAPRNELERLLAEIWQDLFGITPVGMHDNFFELGGHSLLATQLNARVYSKLRVEMSLATLLQAPTVSQLAVAVVSAQAAAVNQDLLDELLDEVASHSGEEIQRLLSEETAAAADHPS